MTDDSNQLSRATRAIRRPFLRNVKPWEERLSTFFDSKAVFFTFSTIFAGTLATLSAAIPSYLNREELRQNAAAENARRDTDTVLKLSPLLLSADASSKRVAKALLTHLKNEKGVGEPVIISIEEIFKVMVIAAVAPDATPETRALGEEISADKDSAALNNSFKSIAAADFNVELTPIQRLEADDKTPRPVRVYIQTRYKTQDALGKRLQLALRAKQMLAPRIEVVTKGPDQTELRYCPDKVEDGKLDEAKTVINAVLAKQNDRDKVKSVPMAAKLCAAVRLNHLELWLKPESK